MGRSSSSSQVLHLFLIALYTNLAADVAKLGVSYAYTGGGRHRRLYRDREVRYPPPVRAAAKASNFA